MTAENDREYYRRRASQERDAANSCPDNSIALTHLRMADEYDRRASLLEASQPVSTASEAAAL